MGLTPTLLGGILCLSSFGDVHMVHELTATVRIDGLNKARSMFVEQYLHEQIGFTWGNAETIQIEDCLELRCKWHYSNLQFAEEDYECISERLSFMKRAGIVSSFFTTVLQKEMNAANHS